MYTLFVSLIILTAIVLSVVILLQSGKGGGLAATFGGTSSSTESFMGGRAAATILTKLSWIGGGVFLFLALILSILSARGSGPSESVLRQEVGGGTGATQAPTSVLEAEGTGEQGAPIEDGSGGRPEGEGSGGTPFQQQP